MRARSAPAQGAQGARAGSHGPTSSHAPPAASLERAPRLAVSIGCPCGIGPEVSVAAAAKLKGARVVLVGDEGAIAAAARVRGVDASRLEVFQPGPSLAKIDRKPGHPTRASGAAQLAWIDAACDLVLRGEADALVTGPVSKEWIAKSGAPGSRGFLGHTEHLARRLGAREVVMAFYGEKLVTSLVTTHLPIARVPRAVTPAAVARATFWLVDLLAAIGNHRPTIAVCGLNPHAGEAGLLGREDLRAIEPGIARARARLAAARVGADLVGPVPAESAFRHAVAGRFDGVVAMYHDQATIPMKIASFGEAVNVSLGLPIVRTSVDHGTAYDLAGKGAADARAMLAAMELAAFLSGARTRPRRAAPSRSPRAQTRSA